ncbi:MAG TPA: hypothetical protein VFA10_30155 [Ktedonobacteraceae bacterium]|nr:hypothetical protein [Ktedonobacteraceae bacterium]
MPDNEVREYQEGNELQFDGDQMGKSPVVVQYGVVQDARERQLTSSKPSSLQKRAERRAVDDALTLEEIVEGGQYITLDAKLVARRVRAFAQEDITNDDLKDDSDWGYEDLLKEYQDAYQRKFHEKIQSLSQWVTTVRDEKERRLREKLSQDRALVQTRSPGDWHARDLVLIRILQIYYWDQLEQVDITMLLERHAFIDRYEKFVLDFASRSEVTWPDPNSFRP